MVKIEFYLQSHYLLLRFLRLRLLKLLFVYIGLLTNFLFSSILLNAQRNISLQRILWQLGVCAYLITDIHQITSLLVFSIVGYLVGSQKKSLVIFHLVNILIFAFFGFKVGPDSLLKSLLNIRLGWLLRGLRVNDRILVLSLYLASLLWDWFLFLNIALMRVSVSELGLVKTICLRRLWYFINLLPSNKTLLIQVYFYIF